MLLWQSVLSLITVLLWGNILQMNLSNNPFTRWGNSYILNIKVFTFLLAMRIQIALKSILIQHYSIILPWAKETLSNTVFKCIKKHRNKKQFFMGREQHQHTRGMWIVNLPLSPIWGQTWYQTSSSLVTVPLRCPQQRSKWGGILPALLSATFS